jgi:GTP-binding protein YchF
MSSLSCGIVGLPNVGKSTLFNALTANEASSSNYPFCTIDPNVGIVDVLDHRLDKLATLSKSQRIIYATMQFTDIAGLVKGASKGEGLGNKFLANIRECDAILHVVRCFDDENVIHVAGKIDPIEDIEVINLELILADLQMVENIILKAQKQARGQKGQDDLILLLKKIEVALNENKPVRSLDFSEKEEELLLPYSFLTKKRVLYVANVTEDALPSLENDYVKQVREYAHKEKSDVITICAKLESEIVQLDEEDRKEMLESLELKESGLNRLIKASFSMLDLITFITTGEIETRAWTIRKGTVAKQAAGKIHTDIEKGFIRAEVMKFTDVVESGGRNQAKEKGLLMTEGKEYVVEDGDVMLFLHS